MGLLLRWLYFKISEGYRSHCDQARFFQITARAAFWYTGVTWLVSHFFKMKKSKFEWRSKPQSWMNIHLKNENCSDSLKFQCFPMRPFVNLGTIGCKTSCIFHDLLKVQYSQNSTKLWFWLFLLSECLSNRYIEDL